MLAAGILGAGSILAAGPARAASIYTAGHGDIGVEYTSGETEFEAHWHLGAGAVVDGSPLGSEAEYEPGDIVGQLSTTTEVSNASVAAALGVATGTTVYRMGNTAYPPNIGFALEEVGADTDWQDGTITLTMTSFSGPGALAISQTISGFGTFVWFSSEGESFTVDDNKWEFGVGGHQHNEWWFTEKGNYEVTFEWNGTYIGAGGPTAVSSSGTFGFQVVPEPGSAGLLAAGLSGMAFLRRRTR
jgi:surface-anchored protein